jgi:hypothetical protein
MVSPKFRRRRGVPYTCTTAILRESCPISRRNLAVISQSNARSPDGLEARSIGLYLRGPGKLCTTLNAAVQGADGYSTNKQA